MHHIGRAAHGLVERSRSSVTQRLSEHVLSSRALGRDVGVRILVPDALPDGRSVPVLWLLHGGDDDFRSWSDAGEVERLCDGMDLVVVMPDCGPGGWYTDWSCADGPGGPQQWETHHLGELMEWVQAHVPVRTDRAGRAIAGLSMGGFGAMKYAARHPDRFCFAAAFSGAVDIVDPHLGLFADAMAGLNGGRPGDIWGDRDQDLVRWRANNPVDLAANLATLELQLRTGDGRPGGVHGGDADLIETTVHQTSTTLHTRLADLGTDHVWDDYGPGAHAWPYWVDALERTLPAVMSATDEATLDERHAAPTVIEHLSHDAEFDLWGWSVRSAATSEDAPTRLRTDATGWSVETSGTAVVATPAMFEPGHTVQLVIDDVERELRSGTDGRLCVQLDATGSGVSRVLLVDRPAGPLG
jgi:diacylglycerol O-acyltransferase / trehalose O-mycolyltransferase